MLAQRLVIAFTQPTNRRQRAPLTGLAAHLLELIQPRWIALRQAHHVVPAVGDGCELFVEVRAKLLERKQLREVQGLATLEEKRIERTHVPERPVIRIDGGERIAFGRGKQPREYRLAFKSQPGLDGLPVEFGETHHARGWAF